MKILKRIAVWILAFVMFFIPSAPLGVSAAETADKIQVDHDKSNDTYFVHDTNIILFCLNNGLAWPSKELGLPTEANYSPMDFKDFLIANGITDSEKINTMTNQLETILYAGYLYNGANLYSNADAVDTITVEEYDKFLVPPSVIRKDFPDEIGNEVFTYNDVMSKNEKYKKLQKFVKKVFDMGDSTTKSGLTRIEIHSLPFYQAIMATNYGDPLQVLPAMMGDSYYVTEYQAYEATSNAIWSLMAENGVPDNSPVQKKPLTNSLLGLSGANILKSEPSSSAVSITGDGEFKFDTTDKKWKTGTLTLNAPSNYYAKYTFQLPDGVKTLNGKDFASAGESFQLVSDNEPADNLFVSASADVLWMEGNLKVYHPPEGLLSEKLDTNGNPERFQNMVGAVINKANVGTSMALSKESTEVSFTVTKNWDDDNNRDGIRPGANDFASKLHLMNGETEVTGVVPSVVDNNDGTYTVKYTNLAKNAAGTPITYSVKEDAVSGYTTDNNTALNGGVITNTHTPERINVVVTKKWDDNNNQDRVRPDTAAFARELHLKAGEIENTDVTPEVTIGSDNTYVITYSNLLKNENGAAITYTVSEGAITGYATDNNSAVNGGTITNVHTPDTTEITITKRWDDGNNQDGIRPDADAFKSKLHLLGDGSEVNGATAEVIDNNDGTYTVKYANLQKNKDGNAIEYTISEDGVDGYTADKTAAKNGETITNTHTPEVIDITVTKNWVDDNNRDGIRPDADAFKSKLHLLGDGSEVNGATAEVIDNNDGTYTVKYANLQKNKDGNAIEYTISEDGVDGYTADKTAAKNGETITNTHTPEVIDITVTKNWVDDNNRDGIRPGANDFASKLHLMNGETEVTGVVPSVVDNNDGTYTVKYTNLAKNAAGTPITYSVKEDAVSGYTTDNNTALNGGVITNTHTPERTNVVVTIKWDDNNNQDRVRPGADEFASKLHLLADGTEVDGVTAEVVDNNDGTYTVTYSDILKYENGNIIVYGITEDDIAGYSSAQDVVYEGEVLVNVHKVKENNGENGGNKDNTDNNSKNNLNNKSDKKVDTADHSNNMIYYVLIVISATGIISAAAVAGRKKH